LIRQGFEQQLPMTIDQFIASRRNASMRSKYTQAYELLKFTGWRSAYEIVHTFVKAEKVKDISGKYKPPRLIQFRHPCFVMSLGSRIARQEHAFYSLKDHHGYPCIAKMHDSFQRAEMFAEFVDRRGWGVFMMDFKAFDAHQTTKVLEQEHKLMAWMNHNDRKLAWLLKKTRKNTAYTVCGTKYTGADGRMSGEFTTGYGNSLNALTILRDMCTRWGIPEQHYKIYLDGDDANIFMNNEYKPYIDMSIVTDYGQEATYGYATTMDDVEFCQCKPIWDGTTWRMIRDPMRILERSRYSVNTFSGKGWKRLMYSIAKCELSLNAGIPIVQAWFSRVLELVGQQDLLGPRAYERLHRMFESEWLNERPVTEAARLSFALAFGIDQQTQRMIEQRVSKLTWDVDDLVYHLDHDRVEHFCYDSPRQDAQGNTTD